MNHPIPAEDLPRPTADSADRPMPLVRRRGRHILIDPVGLDGALSAVETKRSHREKSTLTLWALVDAADPCTGVVSGTEEALARSLAVDPKTFRRRVRPLLAAGLLERLDGRRGQPGYRLLPPAVQLTGPPRKASA